MLETKKTQFAIQLNKNVTVNALHGQSKVLLNNTEEENKPEFDGFQTDKPFSWSPKGTYLVCIKSDKAEFCGGS